jgi:hypothetical protein
MGNTKSLTNKLSLPISRLWALFFLVLAIFSMFSIVSAQPPLQQSSDQEGYILETSYPQYHKRGTDLYIHTHVYNSSSGKLVNTGLSCYSHAYSFNLGGQHILSNITLSQYGAGYNATIPAHYFSDVGTYALLIWCNDSLDGGFLEYAFDVNAQGKEYTSVHGTIYAILMSMLFLIFLLTLYGAIAIQGGNGTGSNGQVLFINYMKYFKIFLGMVSYVCILGITYFAWNLSYGILEFSELSSFFYFLFRMLYVGLIVLFPVIVVISFVKFLHEKGLEKLIARNITIK